MCRSPSLARCRPHAAPGRLRPGRRPVRRRPETPARSGRPTPGRDHRQRPRLRSDPRAVREFERPCRSSSPLRSRALSGRLGLTRGGLTEMRVGFSVHALRAWSGQLARLRQGYGAASVFDRKQRPCHVEARRAKTDGGPGGTRTPDLRFRKALLYPAELPGQTGGVIAQPRIAAKGKMRMGALRHFRLLYVQVLIGIALGVLVGWLWPEIGVQLKPLGDAFIKLIKMAIAPVIFCTIAAGMR